MSNRIRRTLAAAAVPMAVLALAGCAGQANENGVAVIKYGDTDLTDLGWTVVCTDLNATATAEREGEKLSVLIIQKDGEAQSVTIVTKNDADLMTDGVSWSQGSPTGKIDSFKYDQKGEVAVKGEAPNVVTSETVQPFEVKITCPSTN